MRDMMQRLGELIREVYYGVSAGAAVWHGTSLPERPRRRGTAPTSPIVRMEIIHRSDVADAPRHRDAGSLRLGNDWRSPA